MELKFDSLGKGALKSKRELETFEMLPEYKFRGGLTTVEFDSGEVCSLCPVTGQPDINHITILFEPKSLLIETKSLKEYLWSWRDEGIFCEALATAICNDVYDAVKPYRVSVTVVQNIRGGIVTKAIAEKESYWENESV